MKRKIICISLCIIMMILSLPSAFVSAAVSEKNAAASMHLSNLGVMEKSFWQEGNEFITREEFAGIVYSISGDSASYDAIMFSDVDIDSKYYNAIEYCVHNGLINGYEDGSFRPTQPITVIEAAKVFTIFAGYNSQAFYEGGYSFGYSSVARHIGLFDHVKIYDEKAFITRSQLAQMTYNTLVCPYFGAYAYDEKGNVSFQRTGERVCEHYMGIHFTEGIIKSNGIIAVDSVPLENDRIYINGRLLLCGEYEFLKNIGLYAECFYDENDVAKSVVSDSIKTQTLTLRGVDIDSASANTVSYNENGKIKKVSIKQDALYYYNGVAKLGYDINAIAGKANAELYMISNDGDNSYEIVFVNEYNEMVVGSRSANGDIVDLFDSLNKVVIDEDSNVPVRIVNEKGEAISYDDIMRNHIISVMQNSSFTYVKVSTRCVSGALEAKSDDYVTIGGEDFEASQGCIPKINALAMGSNVKAYINSMGIMIEIVNNGGEAAQYGYLCKAGLDTGLSSRLQLKVFTTEGEMKVFSAADKIKIDDSPIETKKLSDVPPQLKNIKTLIGFNTDGNGDIKKIFLPSESYGSGESKFYCAVKNQTVKYHTTNGLVDGNHIIGSNTLIMQVPEDSDFDNDDEFMLFTKSALYTANYPVDIYYYSALSEYCDVAVFHGASQKMVEDSYIAVLSSVYGTKDDKGNDVIAAKYMSKNQMNTAYVPEKLLSTFNSMGKGDVFRFSVNAKGYFSDIKWIYDLSSAAVKNSIDGAWSDSSRVVTKYIVKVGTGTLRFADSMGSYNDSTVHNQEIVPVSSPYITVVEDNGRTIREGSIADISEGSKVVMYIRSTTPRAIVVYNND